MNESTNSGLTDFLTEKARTTFDLEETLSLLRGDFPLRTSSEEFQKAVKAKAQSLGIRQEELIKKALKPQLGGQNFRNWWTGKVAISRDSAIRITFALEKDAEEAHRFLTYSCGHNGFYLRDYKDLVYVFHLNHKLGYKKATVMIDKLVELDQPNPDAPESVSTLRITERLQKEFEETVASEETLFDFLLRKKEYFGSFRRRAYETFAELYETLKESSSYSDSVLTDDDIRKMVLMNIPSLRGRPDITHKTLRKIAETTLPRSGLSEIINKTPDKKTGAIPQVDRRHLILAWLVAEGGGKPYFENDPETEFEECIRRLNYATLEPCGMPHLDARNPFDWLIINALYFCYFESADDDAVERIEAVTEALYGREEGVEG